MASKPILLGLVSSDFEQPDRSNSVHGLKVPSRITKSKQESQTPPSNLFIFKNQEFNIIENTIDEPRSEDRLSTTPGVVDEGNITVSLVTSSKSVSTENKENRIKSGKNASKKNDSKTKTTKRKKISPLNVTNRFATPKQPVPNVKYYRAVKDAILNDQSMRNHMFEAGVNELRQAASQLSSSMSPRKASKVSLGRKKSITSKAGHSPSKSGPKTRKTSHKIVYQNEADGIFSKKKDFTLDEGNYLRNKNSPKTKKKTSSDGSVPQSTARSKGEKAEQSTEKISSKEFYTAEMGKVSTSSVEGNEERAKDIEQENNEYNMSQDGRAFPQSNIIPVLENIPGDNPRSKSSVDSSVHLSKTSSAASSHCQYRKPKGKKENKRNREKSSSPSSTSSSVYSAKSGRKSKKTKSKVPQKHSTYDSEISAKKDKKSPQVHELLANCESYMNWSHRIFSNEALKSYINDIEIAYLEPPPSGQFIKNEVIRYESFECVACLGALCFFHIEFSQLQAAKETIDKTKEFVDECLQKGALSKDHIYSLDYVWDFLRLYASKREWDLRNQFKYFPEMNLFGFNQNIETLKPKVKAGIYGMKAYFLSLIDANFDKQVETLRQAISFDHGNPEWHCCLQRVLRQRREKNAKPSTQPKLNYSIDDELQESWTAVKLAPNHPRCILGAMEVITDIATAQESGFRWNPITFGTNKFYNMTSVLKFLKEEAKKVSKHVPQSLNAGLVLADIFLTQLPKNFRDAKFGKECLDRCLQHHPESAKANLRIAQFHLNVDNNYSEAEMYFDTAFSLDKRNYTAVTGLLHCMMRTLVKRQGTILELIKKQLKKKHWNQKQLASLRYLRGLTLFGLSKPTEAFEEFLRAYKTDEGSLDFHELPAIHKHFGWPGWPSTTLLNFGNLRIEAEVFKEELANSSNHDDARVLALIIKEINKADDMEKQNRVAKKRLLSKRNSIASRASSLFKQK